MKCQPFCFNWGINELMAVSLFIHSNALWQLGINRTWMHAINTITSTSQKQLTAFSWPGVAVTKPTSSIMLFAQFFRIIKALIAYWISHSYLTGASAAQLQWHLSNMNVTPWWRHQMETFSALLAICAGNSLVTSEFPTHTKASDTELWCFLWSAPEWTIE